MKRRKLLFLVFTDEQCKQNHAFMYAIDIHKKGHDVKLILEGPAVQALKNISNKSTKFSRLFSAAKELNLLAGVCKTASGGCGSNDSDKSVTEIARTEQINLLDDLDGHAGIENFIYDGYEVVVF